MGNILVREVASHRNGVSGQPFDVVRFTGLDKDDDDYGKNMVAVVFHARCAVAVLDADATAAGNIAFAKGNSWRGDHYESALREAIDLSDATYGLPEDVRTRVYATTGDARDAVRAALPLLDDKSDEDKARYLTAILDGATRAAAKGVRLPGKRRAVSRAR